MAYQNVLFISCQNLLHEKYKVYKYILKVLFLNEYVLIFFWHTVECFHLFMPNILFTNNHLFAHSLMLSSIAI